MGITTLIMGFVTGFLHNIPSGERVYARPRPTIMHGVKSGLLFSLCTSIIDNIIPYVTNVLVAILFVLIVYNVYRLNR